MTICEWFRSLFAPRKPADVIPIKPAPVQPKPPLKPVGKTRVLGVDVSHYEPMVDWAKANAGGVEWMITKATEGVSHVDKTLFAHTNAARGHCLVGAYHFFHASMDGAKQAELYLKAISTLPYRLDLPHCLDWESSSADGMSSAHQQREALAWLNKVESAAGRVPIIYGGEAFLRELKLPESFARYPLWLAHYGTTEEKLKIPAPWKRLFAWQYTDAETVPGLAKGHHVDANWFFGSVDDLKAIGRDS